MGALLSIPVLAGGLGSLGSTLCTGCTVFMGMSTSSSTNRDTLGGRLTCVYRRDSSFGHVQVVQLQLVHRNPCRLWSESSSEGNFDIAVHDQADPL